MRLIPLVLLSACGILSKPTSDELIAEYQEANGGAIAFTDCGFTTPSDTCQFEGPPPALDCVLDGFGTCRASMAQFFETTVEGARIETTVLVHAAEGACTVTVFTDNTEDEFAEDRAITQESCTGVDDSQNACDPFVFEGCTEVDRW